MEEKLGLITGIECKFVKTDPSLIESLANRTGMTTDKIKGMMRYNIFTVNQFSQLTGKAISTITNLTRPIYRNGVLVADLDVCFPFEDNVSLGPKYVVRNEKAEKYLKA